MSSIAPNAAKRNSFIPASGCAARNSFCSTPTPPVAAIAPNAGSSHIFPWLDAEGALTCDGVVTEISYLGQDTEAGTTYTAYVAFDVPEGVRLGMTVTATVTGDE